MTQNGIRSRVSSPNYWKCDRSANSQSVRGRGLVPSRSRLWTRCGRRSPGSGVLSTPKWIAIAAATAATLDSPGQCIPRSKAIHESHGVVATTPIVSASPGPATTNTYMRFSEWISRLFRRYDVPGLK